MSGGTGGPTGGATEPTPAFWASSRPRQRGRSSLAGICWARTVVELKQFFRQREALVFIFAFPIVLLVIFASAFSSESSFADSRGVSITAAQYYLTGMLSSAILLTSFQDLASSIAVERDDGTLKRLRGTPMPKVAFFVGKIAQVVIVTLAQLVLLLVVARLAYDVPLPDSADVWLRLLWLVLLGCGVGTVLGIAFSSVPRSARSASAVVTPVAIVLQFISGVYFPFYSLPGWMQGLAGIFPLKWLAQGIRSVFLPPEMVHAEPGDSWHLGLGAVVMLVWLVFALVFALRTFRWARRDDG